MSGAPATMAYEVRSKRTGHLFGYVDDPGEVDGWTTRHGLDVRPVRRHRLKTWPEYFADVAAERKPFEVRRNDRDFREGDLLDLVEFEPQTGRESGKIVTRRAGYILRGPGFGIEAGYCVIGLEKANAI